MSDLSKSILATKLVTVVNDMKDVKSIDDLNKVAFGAVDDLGAKLISMHDALEKKKDQITTNMKYKNWSRKKAEEVSKVKSSFKNLGYVDDVNEYNKKYKTSIPLMPTIGFVKFFELFSAADMKGEDVCIFVAESPGQGFICAHMLFTEHVFMSSAVNKSKDGQFLDDIYNLKDFPGVDSSDMDISKSDVQLKIIKQAKSEKMSWFISDLGFSSYDKTKLAPFLQIYLYIITQAPPTRGVIIKTYGITDKVTLNCFKEFFNKFKDVKLEKPVLSSVSNNEVYLICENYLKTPTKTDEEFNGFLTELIKHKEVEVEFYENFKEDSDFGISSSKVDSIKKDYEHRRSKKRAGKNAN